MVVVTLVGAEGTVDAGELCAPAEFGAMFDEMVEAQRDYLPDFLN